MEPETCWQRIRESPVAVLSTVRVEGGPRSVPVVFGVTDDRRLVTAVDHKPKSTRALRRLDDIATDPRVALLWHHYADDWTQLWWVRLDGTADVIDDPDPDVRRALTDRYPQYARQPPAGPWILITPHNVTGWRAG
jgi:PPOX class probable F420-dependent enzyme